MADRRRVVAAELHRAWNRKLYWWWHRYNEDYLDCALEVPLIALSRGEREWGYWDRAHRRLGISARHIETRPWLEVMETLRHEMAHQYADEVLAPEGEGPHGPAWRRACEKLRCSPRVSGGGEAAEATEQDRILRVIRKVLSLASSPNEHEAESAVKKARRLLLRYNVEEVELDRERRFGSRCLGPVKARRASFELWLGAILQDFFFVEVLWAATYEARSDKSGTILQIYGTDANLEMASYAYDFLAGSLEGLWRSYRKRRGVGDNRERQRYFAGTLEGFYRKLQEQESAIRGTRSMVWKGDGRLQQYYRYLNPRVHSSYGRGVAASSAYRDGLEAGRRLVIHRPLRQSKDGQGGYLTGGR